MTRDANGMSAVTTNSPGRTCPAIQSSAASALFGTTTCVTIGSREGRRPPLETMTTGRRCRSATFSASAFTGQASPSMKMRGKAGWSVGGGLVIIRYANARLDQPLFLL